tara:strand:- start:525 stop:1358 length:834 start_codon:yes stop_codon:yes gene_type:complete
MNFRKHSPRKRFGQHWLVDQTILERIIQAAELKEGDRVLEVGPGKGVLTKKLLESRASAVHAIELDRDLVQDLKKLFIDYPNFSLKEGDILTAPLTTQGGLASNKVVANIPYNITGPLLLRLLGSLSSPIKNKFELLILLLQKEVSDRILAFPGSSNFGALSVRMQLLANCKSICDVPPSCFDPSPKVQSSVIAIEPSNIPYELNPKVASNLELLLNCSFSSRRKKLRNTLGSIADSTFMYSLASKVGFDLNQRPQELSPDTWLLMAKEWNNVDKIS